MSHRICFEIGTEEIPHGILSGTILQMKEISEKILKEKHFQYRSVAVKGTPRRVVLFIEDLEAETESLSVEKKGPPVKAAYDSDQKPTKALLGFLRSQNAAVEDTEIREIKGNQYIYLTKSEPGAPVEKVLPEAFAEIIDGLKFPKAMKWGSYQFHFVRPVRWLLAMMDEKILEFDYEHLKASNITKAHRLYPERDLTVKSAGTYEDQLREAMVIADQEERKRIIQEKVKKEAEKQNAVPLLDEGLLETLVNLTEYPNAGTAQFEEEFLKLPKEVLISEMIEHQKYIPLMNQEKELVNRFIVVTNTVISEEILYGNERVLRARFNDGKFFFEEDRKKPLADYVPDLSQIQYANNLGTVLDKTGRIEKLTGIIAETVGEEDAAQSAIHAAHLCKADLLTSMVFEFTELQGVIGYYYALASGEPLNTAITVKEHYLPKFSGDELPSITESALVSLADRFDNLLSMYSKGRYVTGSKDPFALRRQTLGLMRILIEKKYHLSIPDFLEKIFPIYEKYLEVPKEEFSDRVEDFIKIRVKTVLKEYGFAYDEIEAGIPGGVRDVYDTFLRIRAIHTARQGEGFESVTTAFKRVSNIIKSAGEDYPDQPDEAILKIKEEKELFSVYQTVSSDFAEAVGGRDYKTAVSVLISLRPVVDRFFDEVLVMDKDNVQRKNRLALLSKIHEMFEDFINFESIVIESEKGKS